MAGYLGTEQQARLQRRVDQHYGWLVDQPGACDAGRMLGCDDAERLGWEQLLALLRRDGAVAFRLLPATILEALRSRLAGDGYGLDTWDVFVAPAAVARRAIAPLLAKALPDDLHLAGLGEDPEGQPVRSLQGFLLEHGIAPFSGSQLLGRRSPAVTLALADAAGRWVAAAHCYLPHNRHSQHHRWAWGGLVCVAPFARGRGLGGLINALIVEAAIGRLGADWIYELVASGNVASRRMVEASGLRLDPMLVCGIASQGGARYTR